MKVPMRIHHSGQVDTFHIETGTIPFDLIRKKVPSFGHACNGNGTCGKCRIFVDNDNITAITPPEASELRLLGHELVEAGHRLACQVQILNELDIYIDIIQRKAKITASVNFPLPEPKTAIQKSCLSVPLPSLEDQRSDWARLNSAAFIPECFDTNKAIRELPAILKAGKGQVTLVMHKDRLSGFQVCDYENSLYGISVDIGTTTIAACLVNLIKGVVLDVDVTLNSQRKFGTDVIARIRHTMDFESGASELNEAVITDLRTLGLHLCERNNIALDDIDEWVITGNTTMIHLLMQWPSAAIAAAPFIPASVQETTILSDHLGLSSKSHSITTVLPGVSAYVGADTVSAVLSCKMHKDTRNTLVVDLGTNGELVLSGKNGMLACSTAAGPAFEGAGIRFGMGAVDGAIDKVFLSKHQVSSAIIDVVEGISSTVDSDSDIDKAFVSPKLLTTDAVEVIEDIAFTVLGDGKPVGMCGTGLLDIIGTLVTLGVIDETGRIQDAEDLLDSVPVSITARITELDHQPAFLLAPANTTEHGQDILLTQKDIREFQNAKAAISAGISTLANVAGIPLQEIDVVYLAGGLGTWLNPDSAIATGLIPQLLEGKIQPVGNAALAGATQCLVSTDVRDEANKIAKNMHFVELSGRKDFNDMYVDAMMFGEE